MGNADRSASGDKYDRGAFRLRSRLRLLRWSQADLARAMKVSTALVCRWMNGERRPSLSMALRLQSVAGVPVQVWK